MPKVSEWDPYKSHVQGGLPEGQFLNGQFILIAAGPPFFSQVGDKMDTGIYPIGLTQNFALSQNKAISRIFEIGSERSYFISGRSVGQLSLGRVVYHGPSLLRCLYASYTNPDEATFDPLLSEAGHLGSTGIGGSPVQQTDLNKSIKIPPGYDNMFLNLASDLFSQPIGLLLKLMDNHKNTIAQIYLEQCYIPQHSLAVDSQGLIIQEQVGVQYERMMPVNVATVGTLTTEHVGMDDETKQAGWA
jgi:hypothetical protein